MLYSLDYCMFKSLFYCYLCQQCDYSLEVSVRIGENSAQSVSCPIERVLPVENAQVIYNGKITVYFQCLAILDCMTCVWCCFVCKNIFTTV